MARLVGHRAVFVGGLAIFTVTMAATIVSPSIVFLNVVTAFSGVGFAALTATPNMLVTMYNSDRQVSHLWQVCEQHSNVITVIKIWIWTHLTTHHKIKHLKSSFCKVQVCFVVLVTTLKRN